MDNYIKSIFEIFSNKGTCNFNKIKQENSKDFFYERHILSAAYLARDIYYNGYDFYKSKGVYRGSSCEVDHVKFDFILDDNANAILVIRGTSNLSNWLLNFSTGLQYFVSALLSLILMSLLIIGLRSLISFFNLIKGDLQKIALAVLISIVLILVANYLKSKIFGRLNYNVKHCAYHCLAKRIMKKIHPKLDGVNNLLVIGHSMSGGVAEEVLLQSRNINVKIISFNSAVSRISSIDRVKIDENAITVTYLFDLLTFLNLVLITPTNKLNIDAKKIRFRMRFMFLTALVVIAIGVFYKEDGEFLFDLLNLDTWKTWKGFILNFSIASLLIQIILNVVTVVKSFFVNNHLMNSVIDELDDV